MSVDYKGRPITEASIGVTVVIPGWNGGHSEEWEMASGGANTAQRSKTRIGTDPNRTVVLPSVRDAADLSLTRNMVMPNVWHLYQYLNDNAGRLQVKVWMNPLDADGVPISQASGSDVVSSVYVGILASVTPPQAANESSSVASISITITGDGWKKTG